MVVEDDLTPEERYVIYSPLRYYRETKSVIEEQISELKKKPPTEEIEKEIQELNRVWHHYDNLQREYKEKPEREYREKLAKYKDAVQRGELKLVRDLEKELKEHQRKWYLAKKVWKIKI